MSTIPFTTRLDADLKSRLQKIAAQDSQSVSFMAKQAIENFVAEREATMDLVDLGLKLADKGVSIPEKAIQDWMRGPADAPFPRPDSSQ